MCIKSKPKNRKYIYIYSNNKIKIRYNANSYNLQLSFLLSFLFPILLYCTGDYSFRAQEQGQEIFIQSTQFPFHVIDYPEISIRPLTLTVSKGGSRANFTCRITNEKDLEKTSDNPSFVWMVNNKTFSASKK